MADTIIMPQLGETVAEGKILTWFKKIGDAVAPGDRLFEVETDKVTIDVEAIASGTITAIAVGDGETATIGTVVAVLDGAVAAPAAVAPPAAEPVANEAPTLRHEPVPPPSVTIHPAGPLDPFEEVRTPVGRFGNRDGLAGLKVTPLARRLIAQSGADTRAIADIVRGRQGHRVGRADVEAVLATAKQAPAPVQPVAPAPRPQAPTPSPAAAGGTVIPLNAIRQRTGERLAENWRTIPHVFQAVEVDFTRIDKARLAHREAFKAATGLSLTYLPFIARATAMALTAFPQANARFEAGTLYANADVNLGIAVDLGHNGLVVPVVRQADGMTVAGLAKAIGRLVQKARAGKLGLDDLSGGTYSISNNGAFGTLFTTPIINAPQVAILSTDAIRPRPAVVRTEAGDVIVPRLMGMVGQSFDHRAFDGAYSAAFLSHLKTILEERDWHAELA
ncbi:dihydrolipoamide acetyltransferase family protein [Segnochrobactrum spirostomi]|uniref:Dihydrolipoamide acetyltransferase component of pyruvate dehydrogenase complex n=1 Tax=Segnochrobactrum spirostomi TaxID=2608987 RepID=A0A6A7Y9V2_9HYPH|nr:dihydrolipoamide acetyltransferase family protein [Segnochrobactrum spirostomi]MQT14788.1 2-oxo acid dehydrogenase subunit E2 [Segnochrobactrum spirostomi]